jgi:hypothetical protein
MRLVIGIRMRLAIAIFTGFLLAACTTSLAQAAEGSGKIAGKVTSAATEAPIAGIEVCAFPKTSDEATGGGGESEEEGTEEELAQCPTTAANGEYTISGLASGEYIVGFGSPFMSELNYVTQFYNGKSAYAEAQPVTVTAGGIVSGIDAKLAEGGRIVGRVTDVSTGAAIERATVCAFGSNPESGGCGFTNANGEYTIAGLLAGEYKVGFADPPQYAVQYYNGRAALSEASAVSVLLGSTVSGIDAALAPKPPTPPSTTGVPTAPGAPTGPAQSTGPQPRVKVTSMGVLKPGRSRLLHVKLTCNGAPCHGLLELTASVLARHREGARVVLGPETVILAKGSFSLAVGKSASIALRLTPAGRKRLAHTERHPLAAEWLLSLASGEASATRVRVS